MPWRSRGGDWENLDESGGPAPDEEGGEEGGRDRSVWRRLPRWACYLLVALGAVTVAGMAAGLYISTYYREDSSSWANKGPSGRLSMVLGPVLGVVAVVAIVTVCVVFQIKKRRKEERGTPRVNTRLHMDSTGVHNAPGEKHSDPNKHNAYQDSLHM